MKEDYLWDKTGSDPGLEKLENALRAFSYAERAQPVLVPVEAAPAKRIFGFRFAPVAFALAACMAVALISWSVWMRASNTRALDEQALSIPTADMPLPHAPAKPPPPYTVENRPPVPPGPKQIAEVSARPKTRRERVVLRTIPAESGPKFTKEEIYAYDQLMLALSITSDKLNLVREKVVGEKN